MKHKKLFAILSLALCTTIFTACGDNKVSLSAYWQKTADISVQSGTETLAYEVVYEPESGIGFNYSVNYTDGECTTVLKCAYDEEKEDYFYTYENKLSIKVHFKIKGNDEEKIYEDYVNSKVTFQTISGTLYPISSTKTVYSHSPLNDDVNSLADFDKCLYDYTVETDYGTNKSTVTDNAENSTQSYTVTPDSGYTTLDNEQLLFALRGVNPTLTSSPTFSVYAPFSSENQNINAAFGTATAKKFTFSINGEEKEREIGYYPVTLSIQANMAGQSQEVWVAKTTDADNNEYRNVILQWKQPIMYNYGSLVYKLTSASFIGY